MRTKRKKYIKTPRSIVVLERKERLGCGGKCQIAEIIDSWLKLGKSAGMVFSKFHNKLPITGFQWNRNEWRNHNFVEKIRGCIYIHMTCSHNGTFRIVLKNSLDKAIGFRKVKKYKIFIEHEVRMGSILNT